MDVELDRIAYTGGAPTARHIMQPCCSQPLRSHQRLHSAALHKQHKAHLQCSRSLQQYAQPPTPCVRQQPITSSSIPQACSSSAGNACSSTVVPRSVYYSYAHQPTQQQQHLLSSIHGPPQQPPWQQQQQLPGQQQEHKQQRGRGVLARSSRQMVGGMPFPQVAVSTSIACIHTTCI